jgi:predicted CoA-binding protein
MNEQGMKQGMNEPEVIASLMREAEVWAIVGLSNNAERAAYGVAARLQGWGKRIIPVHPSAPVVHGEIGYPDLASAHAAVGKIDVVDVFVNSALAGDVVDQAIKIGAGAVWLQLGVIDQDAAARAAEDGLKVVMDRCPAIEGRRIFAAS